jgi:vacuolar-type H+-ATPase subunit D/Vma8
MGKQLSYEKIKYFIEVESESNCKLITLKEEYINTKHEIIIKCQCGNEFGTTYDDFRNKYKRQCNECGRLKLAKINSLDFEYVRNFVEKDSDCILLSKEYKNNAAKLKFKCACGNEFETTFADFKSNNKRQCNECGDKIRRAKQKIPYSYVKEYINGADGNGCILLTSEDEYKNITNNIKIKCKCGNEYNTTFHFFKSGNKRQCNKCGRQNMRDKQSLSLEEVKKYIEVDSNSGCVLLSKEYINNQENLDVRCKCGNAFKVSFANFKNGSRKRYCNDCGNLNKSLKRKKGIEKFKKEVYDLVGREYEVLGEYIDALTKIKIRHNSERCNNNEYEVIPADFLHGTRCPICSFINMGLNKRKTHEEFCNEVYNLVGDEYTVVGKYQLSNKKVLIRHNCEACNNYEYKVIPSSFLSGVRCPICAYLNNSGENNWAWKGGITPLHNHLRSFIEQWKRDSLKYYKYKCAITNINGKLIVHHTYSFSKILDETLLKTGLDLRLQISDYSSEELKLLEDTCLQLHYKYGLGVPLLPIIHDLFHQQYGQDGNTDEDDFEEFKERWFAGEFKHILNFDECVNQ